VAFTVSPKVRRIAAHDPHTLPLWDYYKQVFWSSGIDLDEDSFASLTEEVTLDALELAAGEKAVLSIQLPPEFIIIFEPVTHSAHFIDVHGEPTEEPQQLGLIFNKAHPPTESSTLRPGPLRLALDNESPRRTLPTVFVGADALHHLLGKRRPFLTAKRMLSNQTFRDVFKADNLEIDQRLKITSLTFLFTDLKGSTALYERVGDLAAFDLVRAHFHALLEIIAAEKGAVVKTIGDAVMATFVEPDHALVAGLRMRAAMAKLNAERGKSDLVVKIGIHDAQRAAGLFRPDCQYRGTGAGPVDLAGDPHHRSCDRGARRRRHPGERGDPADSEGSRPARHRRQDRGVRDSIILNRATRRRWACLGFAPPLLSYNRIRPERHVCSPGGPPRVWDVVTAHCPEPLGSGGSL
jgi:hypothetical protein